MDPKIPPDPALVPAPPGWWPRWLGLRNRILSSRTFQDLVVKLPFARGVARRRSVKLFDLLAGFTYSQTLFAAVESGLIDLLRGNPVQISAIGADIGLGDQAVLRLLRAAAALDLVEEAGNGWWTLGEQGAALAGNPGAMAMVRHHSVLYADLSDPLALLRQDRAEPTALQAFWEYCPSLERDGTVDAAMARYSELMAKSQAMVAREVLAAHRFNRHEAVLDVGGGHGAFLAALATRHQGPRLGLMDLPGVIEGARIKLSESAASNRITFHPGSFLDQAPPQGYDCVTLVRVIHDHDDEAVRALLVNIRDALPPRGRLVIAEPMAATPGAKPMGDAYFGLYLWAMGRGRPRKHDEIGAMLHDAGFSSWRQVKTRLPVVTSMIVAAR